MEKLADANWVKLFAEIGLGQWFATLQEWSRCREEHCFSFLARQE